MDFEYNDDADESEIYHFSQVIKIHPFNDEDIREILRTLNALDQQSVSLQNIEKEIRDKDIDDARITRYCKTESSHIFKIQLPNSLSFILKLNSEHTYDAYVGITNEVRNLGIEVPINYVINSEGIAKNNKYYFAILQEYIEGVAFEKAVLDGMISPSHKEYVLSAMGSRLKSIHSVKEVKELGDINKRVFLKDALERLDLEREIILSEGICLVDEFEELYEKVESFVSVSEIFAPESFGLVHFNFYPKNILIDVSQTTPSIKAILDWSDSTLSNVYFDFALWDYWCGEDFLIDSLMESYGMESFASSEAKLNVELTTIAALITEFCEYSKDPDLRAAQLGLWQRLKHEVEQAAY